MTHRPETPFDSIEGAHEYVSLLSETIEEAREAVQEDTAAATQTDAPRRVEALKLVTYKLDKLQEHVRASRQLLNDLRTLRRLLLDERRAVLEKEEAAVKAIAPPRF